MNSDLMFVYSLLLDEREKLKAKIKRVDATIRTANTLDREYWKNVRDDFTTQLYEFTRAINSLIQWYKMINQSFIEFFCCAIFRTM